MNKIIVFVFLLFCSHVLLSQSVSEKFIVSYSSPLNVDGSSFSYDQNSGNYIYTSYDSTNKKYTAYTGRGNSSGYDYILAYNEIYDKNGDCYTTAYNNLTDTTYKYFLLKNGQVIATFDFINESWLQKDGIIYFVCKDNNDTYLTKYSTENGNISKGKAYEDITLVYLNQKTPYSEGEPVGELGFTSDNKPYYLASQDDEKFIVVGDSELKHYSDIDMYSVVLDKNNVFTYFAKDSGKYYEPHGKSFLVQGDKEYNKYDYLYAPILFDESNNPIYISGDSVGNYYPQRVMVGNTEGKSYKGGISDLKFTPSGKITFIGLRERKDSPGNYDAVVVIDGKEGKAYNDINNFTFTKNGEPLYSATDEDGSYIITGNKQIEIDYPTVLNMNFMPDGRLTYVAAVYGDEKMKTKDLYYAVIGNNTYGPYDGLVPVNYDNGPYILLDDAGNYAYVVNRLLDPKNYTYESVLYTNSGKSKAFDFIQNLYLYQGKALYFGGKLVDKINYRYKYTMFYGNAQIGSDYDSYSNFKIDDSTGIASFLGLRANAFYAVEIKF